MEQKEKSIDPMKKLVNNDFKYFIGKYIFPIIGFVFNYLTIIFFFKKTYFYFFHYNSYCVYRDLLMLTKNQIDLKNWRGHKIVLWHEDKRISIHDLEGRKECTISHYYSAEWDKNMNHKIYYLFS
jgi:hypothetical protein